MPDDIHTFAQADGLAQPARAPHPGHARQVGVDADGRRRYELLDDTGFDEVPKKYRKFYRRWEGEADVLAPNEAYCPVCKIVMRSSRELREGDKIYCMACMTRLRVVRGDSGMLEGRALY